MASTDKAFRVRVVTRWSDVAAARSLDSLAAAVRQSGGRVRAEVVVGDSPPGAGTIFEAGADGNLDGLTLVPPRGAPAAVTLNELASAAGSDGPRRDAVVFLEGGAVMSPFTLSGLLAALAEPRTAIAGARLLPLGEETGFDPLTGEASWVSAAAMAVRADVFEDLGGFDALRFPDFGFDVDLCWRSRLAGFRVVLAPDAPVFRRLMPRPDGWVLRTPDEERGAFLTLLTLAGRYGLDEVIHELLAFADAEGGDGARQAALEWRTRADALPVLPGHGVASFDGLVPGRRPVP